MTRGRSKFSQRAISRAIRGAKAAGVEVGSIEIDTDGKIVVYAGGGHGNPKNKNSADLVLEKLNERNKS